MPAGRRGTACPSWVWAAHSSAVLAGSSGCDWATASSSWVRSQPSDSARLSMLNRKPSIAATCRDGGVVVGERGRQQRAVVRVAGLDEGLDPRRQHRLAGAVVRQQPPDPAQHLGRAVDAALGRQHLQGAGAQFVGEAAAAQVQDRVLDGRQDGRRGGLRPVGRAAQPLLQDLLDADALVAELDERPLVGAERQVPRFLDRLLAEACARP